MKANGGRVKARPRFIEGLSDVWVLAKIGEELQAQEHVFGAIRTFHVPLDAMTVSMMVMVVVTVMMNVCDPGEKKGSRSIVRGKAIIEAGDGRKRVDAL